MQSELEKLKQRLRIILKLELKLLESFEIEVKQENM